MELYVFKKERDKLKGFSFINSKSVNELCYMPRPGDSGIFASKRKKKERVKEKEEKDYWDTFMFDTACWLNTARILKRKEKEKGTVS